MKENRVIAIDGPAASGKSSVGKRLAALVNSVFVSSGTMYRAFTWAVIDAGLSFEDHDGINALLGQVELKPERQGERIRILVNEVDPGEALTSPEVNQGVSRVAKIPEVREVMLNHQRSLINASDIVMVGRDICSVVFPDTPYKYYLDASEEVRAARRRAQGQDDSIAERDKNDSTRKTSPLVVAEGATVVDTSEMTLDDVVEWIHQDLIKAGYAV
ncbi:MAG: (d)CMP kinase [Verrucomicrobiota bacterium]